MRHVLSFSLLVVLWPGCSKESGGALDLQQSALDQGQQVQRDGRAADQERAKDTGTDAKRCLTGQRPAPTEWMSWTPIPVSPPGAAYQVDPYTVVDSQTCLIWQRVVSPQKYDWPQAKDYCKQLSLAGHADWRLPTAVELKSILDRSRQEPTINVTAFPNTPASTAENWYWTSTPVARDALYTWAVGFLYGVSSPSDVGTSLYVRCVR